MNRYWLVFFIVLFCSGLTYAVSQGDFIIKKDVATPSQENQSNNSIDTLADSSSSQSSSPLADSGIAIASVPRAFEYASPSSIVKVSINDLHSVDVSKQYLIDNNYNLKFSVVKDRMTMTIADKKQRSFVRGSFAVKSDPMRVSVFFEGKSRDFVLTNLNASFKEDNSRRSDDRVDKRLLNSTYLHENDYIIGSQEIPVIIRFNGQAGSLSDYKKELIAALSEHNKITQDDISRHSKKFLRDFKIHNGISALLTEQEIKKISNVVSVRDISLDQKVYALLDQSVPQIMAPQVWAMQDSNGLNVTGLNITIAIIDTGIDYTHPDFQGRVIDGFNFYDGNYQYADDNGHGTHVASIAAGNGELKGVAPNASLISYKVLNSNGGGYTSSIIEALERTADPNMDGATWDHYDIASLSLGGYGDENDPLSQACDELTQLGVVVVIAAGNSGPYWQTIGSPGASQLSITVGASCKQSGIGNSSECNDPVADFSSRGSTENSNLKPDVVAPGVNICAAEYGSFHKELQCYDSKHIALSGTSMATPHVSGAAALLKQLHQDWTPAVIKSALASTATDLNMSAFIQGAGEINISAAANVQLSTDPAVLSFGEVSSEKLLNFTIKNLINGTLNVTITIMNATNGVDSESVLSINETSFSILVDSTILLTANISPLTLDGRAYGWIIINDSTHSYRLPYGYVRFSTLNVHVESSDYILNPDIIVQSSDFSEKYMFFNDGGLGSDASFKLANGNYIVYAIGDPTIDIDYVLVGNVTVGVQEEKNYSIDLADARPFKIKAESTSGVPLRLYEWNIGLRAYRDTLNLSSNNYLIYDALSSDYGNRTVYMNNKPDNNITVDVIFAYHGVPSTSRLYPYDWSRNIAGLFRSIQGWFS